MHNFDVETWERNIRIQIGDESGAKELLGNVTLTIFVHLKFESFHRQTWFVVVDVLKSLKQSLHSLKVLNDVESFISIDRAFILSFNRKYIKHTTIRWKKQKLEKRKTDLQNSDRGPKHLAQTVTILRIKLRCE